MLLHEIFSRLTVLFGDLDRCHKNSCAMQTVAIDRREALAAEISYQSRHILIDEIIKRVMQAASRLAPFIEIMIRS